MMIGISIAGSFPAKIYAAAHRNNLFPGPKSHVRTAAENIPALSRSTSELSLKRAIAQPTGSKKIAVILADFAGADSTTSGSPTMSTADKTTINSMFQHLKGFYSEASYGRLSLDITFFYEGGSSTSVPAGAITIMVPSTMQVYGTGDEEGSSENLMLFIYDALKEVNTPSLRLHHDTYDSVIVVHAGYGNESTSASGDLWSALIGWQTATSESYGFIDGLVIPVRESGASPIGTLCHEFGHVLGLPDVYATNTSNGSQVGIWCLMDSGNWNDDGYSPTHPSPWCKQLLGWITPATLSYTPTTLAQVYTSSGFMPIEVSSSSVYKILGKGSTAEYYLIAFSSTSAYNPNPMSGGVQIWHVDEGIIDGV